MKKFLSIVLSLSVVICLFAACSKTDAGLTTTAPETSASEVTEVDTTASESKTETTTAAAETTEAEVVTADESSSMPKYHYLVVNNEPYTVTEKEGFDNAGVTTIVCGDNGTYNFKSSSADVKWDIYVLDEEFDDAPRYLPQAKEPSLSGDGTLTITEGQLIYIHCSNNAFTASEAGEGYLEITMA